MQTFVCNFIYLFINAKTARPSPLLFSPYVPVDFAVASEVVVERLNAYASLAAEGVSADHLTVAIVYLNMEPSGPVASAPGPVVEQNIARLEVFLFRVSDVLPDSVSP